MKAVQIVSPNQLQVIDVEKPSIDKDNNVLIRMTAAGICGSDVGIYHGTNAAATYPRIIGHEIVGVVEEVGEGADGLKPGDRVIVNQVTSCGHCYPQEPRQCLRQPEGARRAYRRRLPRVYRRARRGLLPAARQYFRPGRRHDRADHDCHPVLHQSRTCQG